MQTARHDKTFLTNEHGKNNKNYNGAHPLTSELTINNKVESFCEGSLRGYCAILRPLQLENPCVVYVHGLGLLSPKSAFTC